MTTVLEEIQETKQIEQEQEDLTIDEIIPKWSHYFDLMWEGKYQEAAVFEDLQTLDIANPSRCVLGEAWKFKDNYSTSMNMYCNRCDEFSFGKMVDFYHVIGYRKGISQVCSKIISMNENLRDNKKNWREHHDIKNFVKHWNLEHKEVTKQKYE